MGERLTLGAILTEKCAIANSTFSLHFATREDVTLLGLTGNLQKPFKKICV